MFPDTRKRVYSVVDLFCGQRAISKAFENRGLKSMAHDVCINVLDVPMVAIWSVMDENTYTMHRIT